MKTLLKITAGFILSVVLYFLSRSNYLLFHNIVEIYSILIAAGIFIVAWNTREYSEYSGLVFLGIAYAFVAVIDLVHTLSYHGMPIITETPFTANQLWIIARFLEAVSLIIFSVRGQLFKLKHIIISISLFVLYTLAAFFSVFVWKNFPACYIEGQGQTQFKILSEYFIIGLFLLSIFYLGRQRNKFNQQIHKLFLLSIFLTVLSELMFTLYTDNYGITNVLGHILKAFSFYLIYRSVIVNTLEKPMETIYSRLNQLNRKTMDANETIQKQKDLLQNTVRELKRNNDTKDKFFKIIAHDLRSPFNTITSCSEILTEEFYDELSKEDMAKFMLNIYESSRVASKVLNNLLDWAKLQTGEIIFIPGNLNLTDLIRETVQLFSLSIKQKGINLTLDLQDSLQIFADKNMILTVLRNILSNAIKFSPVGGEISISGKLSGEDVSISFIDSGCGIPLENQKKIFEIDSKYTTLGSNGEQGSGLGLSLTKEFVDKNSAAISIKRSDERGTEMVLTFKKSLKGMTKSPEDNK